MHINWFPGHMKKTHDLIRQNLKLVDIVIELIDARIPHSSKNPIFDDLLGDKPRVVALNKVDLADSEKLQDWIRHYAAAGVEAVPINAHAGKGIAQLLQTVQRVGKARREKLIKQKRINQSIRMMIIGIPNVGKSTLINQLVGKKVAKTGNRPGVTKGKQWIRIKDDLELFDTPGILWPKIASDRVGLNLASDMADAEPLEIMEAIAVRRGCILPGKQIDYHRVANLLLDEFRKGTIGQMSLETPQTVKADE
ncbi:MAG: ribosome biogenesis GTPase YlqF [Clostridiales bacterium]|nr:MAG: ribosome biogenesis GTPase YlqF [Clostridiales bacterium]